MKGDKKMIYELRHFNTPILRFTATEDSSTPEIEIVWVNEEKRTLLPCVYDDFLGSAKNVLTAKHREGLRHLMNFKFKKHSRYNLPDKRLKVIEKVIQKRAQMLLSDLT